MASKRYNPRSIDEVLAVMVTRSVETGKVLYAYPTYNGLAIVNSLPFPIQHYIARPDGSAAFVERSANHIDWITTELEQKAAA